MKMQKRNWLARELSNGSLIFSLSKLLLQFILFYFEIVIGYLDSLLSLPRIACQETCSSLLLH